MANSELLLKLISEFAKDGVISEIEKMIIKEKASEIGIDDISLELLIQMELKKYTQSLEETIVKQNDKIETKSENIDVKVPVDLPNQIIIDEFEFDFVGEDALETFNEFKKRFNFYYSKSDNNSKSEYNKLFKEVQAFCQNETNDECYVGYHIHYNDGSLNVRAKVFIDEPYIFKNYINFSDVEFIKCIDYPNILIKTKNNFFNFNFKTAIKKHDSAQSLEFAKFGFKAFFGDKFINNWWETTEFDKEVLKENGEKKIKESELEEKRKAEIEDEKKHALKMKRMQEEGEKVNELMIKRLEEEENIKNKAEKERLAMLAHKEWNDKQSELNHKEIEMIIKKRMDSEAETDISFSNNREVQSSKENEKKQISKHEFSSSVTRGGDVINPDKIIIENGTITWKKRGKILIGGESVSIPLDKVAAVELKTGIIGTDIVIRSNGKGSIYAENFATSDAQKIKSLLGH